MHRILKQTVELAIDPELDALAVQDRLSRACRGGELLELDRLFDRLGGDRELRIGRLELDLGDISGDIGGDDWLPAFSRRLAECAEQTLAQAADGTQATQSSGDGRQYGRQPNGLLESLTELRPGRDRFDTLATLLRHGRLPWWSDPPTTRDWVRDECAALTPTDRRELIALAADNPRVLQRLVIQLPATAIGQLLGAELPPGLAGRLATAGAEFESQLALPSMRITEWRAVYWRPLFRLVQSCAARLEPKAVVAHWFTGLSALQPGAVGELWTRLAPAMAVPALPRAWQQAFTEALQRVATGRGPSGQAAQLTPSATDPTAIPRATSPEPGDRGQPGQPSQQTQPPNPSGTANPRDAGTPIAATPVGPSPPPERVVAAAIPPRSTSDHAAPAESDAPVELDVTAVGMVLLHPFLGELFTQLELVDQGQFIDSDRRQIAVQVLGYLAYGAQQRAESELTLSKLLCGMALDEVLVPVDLDAATRFAADALLAAVLKHWTALKSSSHQWLREQFILRVGRLRPVDAGWILTIEGRAQDVLLARLPWGYGVISLPWMDGMLHVNWGD